MFAIGSILISTVTSIKPIQDWVCFSSLNACFMITDDWTNLVMKDNSLLTCRRENPNLAYVQSTLVDNFIHQLCGCNTCDHGDLPDYPPTSSIPVEYSEDDDVQWMMFDESSRQISTPVDIQYILIALTNQLDVSNFLFERIWDKTPYDVVLCSKPFGLIHTANADCRPVYHCEAAYPCPAKEKEAERLAKKAKSTPTPSTQKQTGIKELWALLFLPGFVVGICAAYGFVRYRNNQLRAAREQKMRNQGNTQLTSQTIHVPIHQDVHHAPQYVAPSVQYQPRGPPIQGEQAHMEIKDNVPNAVTQTPQIIHA